MAYEPNDQVTPRPQSGKATSPPPPYPEGTSSEQIRRDIRQTRAEMDETVDSLEERLRPRHLLDDLLDVFRGGSTAGSGSAETMKQAGSKVLEKLKEHPMPAALIGAGVAWLLFEGDGSSSRPSSGGRTLEGYTPRKWDVPPRGGSFVDARTGQPYTADYGKEAGAAGAGGDTGAGSGMAGQAKEALHSAAESARDKASAAAGTVSDWASSAGESARDAADRTREYAAGASEQVRRGYESGKRYLERGLDEYPLAMGAAALAVGVLTGLLLPETRAENRAMGERSDELKDKAKQAGREIVDRGKEVVEATGEAVKNEAAAQGVGANMLAEKAKHVVRDVAQTASESAKREGIDPQSLAHKGKDIAERAKDTAEEEAKRQKDEMKK